MKTETETWPKAKTPNTLKAIFPGLKVGRITRKEVNRAARTDANLLSHILFTSFSRKWKKKIEGTKEKLQGQIAIPVLWIFFYLPMENCWMVLTLSRPPCDPIQWLKVRETFLIQDTQRTCTRSYKKRRSPTFNCHLTAVGFAIYNVCVCVYAWVLANSNRKS